MTIEAGFRPERLYIPRRLQPILPDMLATYADYSKGNRRIIVALCHEDNAGGEVFAFYNGELPETPHTAVIPTELLVPDSRIAVIYPGESYYFSVVPKSRHPGTLILHHVVEPV